MGIFQQINDVILTIVYFIVRILVFPLVYWWYASQNHWTILQLLFKLPWHCHMGTLAILIFNMYWFIKICLVSLHPSVRKTKLE